ncbi:MAG TPA: hypothetical protein VGG70_07710 [Candidatus Cybelea sp.]
MKRAISTLPLALMFVSGIIFSSGAPSPPALAATPKPSPAPASNSKDACGATKSKWAHTQCLQFNSSAPGDEYFGRMKMSYLGIDNTYKDGAISAGEFTTDPRLISKLDFATEALHRWAQKYPNDPQLARSYFLGVLVLRKVYTEPEQKTTWEFMQVLIRKYPNTYFGKTMKTSVAGGFTEHWFAVAQICATPSPSGHAALAATPTPESTPSPSPGQPAVEIITPPCVQPTPQTEATPQAEATTAPSPSKSPLTR